MALPAGTATLLYADSLLAGVAPDRLAKTEIELVAGRPFDEAVELSAIFHDPARLGAQVARTWRTAEIGLAASLAAGVSLEAATCLVRVCVRECRHHFGKLKQPRSHLAGWMEATETALERASEPARSDRVEDVLAAYHAFEAAHVPYETHKLWERAVARAKRAHGEDWYFRIDRGDLVQRVLAHLRELITDIESARNSLETLARANRGERVWTWKNKQQEERDLEYERSNLRSRCRMLGYHVQQCVNGLTMHLDSKTRIRRALTTCVTSSQMRKAVAAARAAVP